MQTFLPYPDLLKTAKVLDYKRLGKQRLEALQLIYLIETNGDGWKNHPARLMWIGHTNYLRVYLSEMINEWINRGYKNTMIVPPYTDEDIKAPSWFGDERLHSSHRAALLAKNPRYYSLFEWTEEPIIDYYWPIRRD